MLTILSLSKEDLEFRVCEFWLLNEVKIRAISFLVFPIWLVSFKVFASFSKLSLAILLFNSESIDASSGLVLSFNSIGFIYILIVKTQNTGNRTQIKAKSTDTRKYKRVWVLCFGLFVFYLCFVHFVLCVLSFDYSCLYRQFMSRKPQRLLRLIFRQTINLEYNSSCFNRNHEMRQSASTAAHSNLA